MTCRIPDFTNSIEFQCNRSSRGSCIVLGCSTNMFKEGNDTVHLQIPSLSYNTDSCEWSCTYGGIRSSAASFTIFSKNRQTCQSTRQVLVSVASFIHLTPENLSRKCIDRFNRLPSLQIFLI